jgi:hypothetical protein
MIRNQLVKFRDTLPDFGSGLMPAFQVVFTNGGCYRGTSLIRNSVCNTRMSEACLAGVGVG